MDRTGQTEKKAYSRPTIVRVKLNPEQAVLGACSTVGSGLSNNNNGGACVVGGCRKSNRFAGSDGTAGS
jgi:hypothetical protein